MTTASPQDGAMSPRDLSPAARALAERCVPRLGELARRMSRGFAEEAAGSESLPGDLRAAEIAAAARDGLRLVVQRGDAQHHRPGDYGAFRERAALRAEEGMPLHLLLRAQVFGVYVLWKTLYETARPGEEAALVELSGCLLRVQEGVAGAVAETYLDEQAVLLAERGERRRSLVRALLDGTLPSDTGLLESLGLEHGGLVLCLRTDRPGARSRSARVEALRSAATRPATPGAALVAERRRRRRIQTALDRLFGTEVLALVDEHGGHAIVPARGAAAGPPVPPEGLVDRLRQAFGCEVRLAAVHADRPQDIAAAARTASEVIRVARASGRPPGLHRMDDVLLEFHLSRRDESSGLIAALLDPIGERSDLLETLRSYLEHQQDRRGTAKRLGLHPNTVDNRLARIADLTGLDLASPRGSALALAALLLREEPQEPFV